MIMNRKKFLTAATLLPFAGEEIIAALNKPAQPVIRLVDTHQHLYDTRLFPGNWGQLPVEGNFGVPEYQQAAAGLHIEKAVYMEVAVPPARKYEEAQYAIRLCADSNNPTVAAVISYDIHAGDFAAYMQQFRNTSCIKGIRATFRNPAEFTDITVIRNVRTLGALGMSLDFSIPPQWLGPIEPLIRSCPGTRFIINHCGNADPKAFLPRGIVSGYPDHNGKQWIDNMSAIAENQNVVCKISGVATRSPGYTFSADTLGPVIDRCLDIFGADRVMFASDWPWCLRGIELSAWVRLLQQVVASRPIADQEKLFFANAEKFYHI